MYCNVVSIDIECTIYTQMHKKYTKADVLAKIGFRLHNNSLVNLRTVPEVYTNRMRSMYKDYSPFLAA